MNIATIYSGFEGVGVGARAAGIDHLWGIEHDDDIAQVARDNGFDVITADATTIEPSQFATPDILHASPPCPNFSTAKQGATESRADIALAKATVRFLETLQPRYFTLENVWLYRRSDSWLLILDSLSRLGYWTDVQHCNAADFGVPQTRKRMIVRAVRGGWLPPLPRPVPWRGWYQAVEDLLPGLEDDEFAPWQIERGVLDLLDETCLLSQGSFDHADGGNERAAQPLGMRMARDPAFSVTANSNMLGMRAFIVNGSNASQPLTIRGADEPVFTVTASGKGAIRAFIVSGQTSDHAGMPGLTVRTASEPMFTVVASEKQAALRAAIPGRVVKMSARCMARFQSFPDDYVLPGRATLAIRGVGNAVPPLMARRILETLT